MISAVDMRQWWSQIRAVIRLEMKKTFFSKRGLWVYLVALAPVLLFAGHSIDELRSRNSRLDVAAHQASAEALARIQPGMSPGQVRDLAGEPSSRMVFETRRHQRMVYRYTDGESDYTFTFLDDELEGIGRRSRPSVNDESLIFATVFQFFFLRLAVFFGCVGIFMNLFRGELIDKSLHYYLLAPIRREVLLVGKYLAGLIATVVIFTTSAALQLWAASMYMDAGATSQFLHGRSYLWSYMGVTALACMGYGSVFLAAGLLFRNPLIPAAAVLIWESANVFLPAALKKVSVIFYLQSLCPVVAPPGGDLSGIWALLVSSAEPAPAALSVIGLLVVTGIVLVLAGLRARKLEINYGTE